MRPCGRCGQAVENNVALCSECAEFLSRPQAAARPGRESRRLVAEPSSADESASDDFDADVTMEMVFGAAVSTVVGLMVLGFLSFGGSGIVIWAGLGFGVFLAISAAMGGPL